MEKQMLPCDGSCKHSSCEGITICDSCGNPTYHLCGSGHCSRCEEWWPPPIIFDAIKEVNTDGFRYCIGCAIREPEFRVRGNYEDERKNQSGRKDFPIGEDGLSDIHDSTDGTGLFADSIDALIEKGTVHRWTPESQIILSGYLSEKEIEEPDESPIKLEIVEKEEK